jgi:hypothetical protein
MTVRRVFLATALLSVFLAACTTYSSSRNPPERTTMSLIDIKQSLVGTWGSIAPEIRPSAQKNPDGSLRPFYLQREFKYLDGDRFELAIVNSADPYGKAPLARIVIKGHMLWRGEHPIAPSAQKVDFVADEAYDVTPLLPAFTDVLNKLASQGYDQWQTGKAQSVFGKTFVPFGLVAGRNFMEYDLVYLSHGLLFWGARHVDGRGFDTEENRPTNLQIPLARR